MGYEAINFGKKFKLFDEQWQPKVIAEMNEYQFKIVRLEGDFIWHDHKNTDETFMVIEGALQDRFSRRRGQCRSRRNVCRPQRRRAQALCGTRSEAMLIEPRGVPNTGDQAGKRTAENDVWITGSPARRRQSSHVLTPNRGAMNSVHIR